MEMPAGIVQIESVLGERYLHQWVLTGERNLLIDTGCADTPETVILPFLKSISFDPARVDFVLLTHADVDHYGGNGTMRAACPSAALLAQERDRALMESRSTILRDRYGWYEFHDLAYPADTLEWLSGSAGADVRIDFGLVGGETIQLGEGRPLRVVNLPGHSAGHMGVYDARNRTMIVADAVLGRGLYNVDGKLISPPPYFSVDDYVATVETVRSYRPALLLTGHYAPMVDGEIERFLNASLQFVQDVDEALVDTLREAREARTLRELTASLNERLGPYSVMDNELAGPVRAHLQRLEAQHRVAGTTRSGRPAWCFL